MNASVSLSQVTAAVDAADDLAARERAAELAEAIERVGVEWDLRLANAIQFVAVCRAHDLRADAPWSAHDASVVRTIADLGHLVAGQTTATRAPLPEAASAVVSERKLDARVAAGVAASAPPAPDAASEDAEDVRAETIDAATP